MTCYFAVIAFYWFLWHHPIYWIGGLTTQKMKFSIKDFYSKCDQIRSFLRIIWSHLLEKTLMENFIFCKVSKLHIAYLELKQPLHKRPYTM